jgi:hypothetical protein
MRKLKDLLMRLGRAWVWIAMQFGVTLVLMVAGAVWTRLPDKHWWQVGLTLLIPVMLIMSLLELEAGTMRKLADNDGRRVKLVWGAATLLVWLVVVGVCWWALDWCDDHIWQWAAYLNSRAPAGLRGRTLTFAHLALWMRWTEWVFRWIAVPGKVTVWAGATAQWGWRRVPVRRILRVLWNWQWWLVVTVAALVAVRWTGHWFDAAPTGTPSAQEWNVGLKLAGTYALAMGAWVVVLAWWAVLFDWKRPEGGANPPDGDALVPVPVLSGPPDRELKAKVVPEDEGTTT